ncbi:MAG: DUF1295 domain-containing protein [Mycoplasma sp.]|nr:DUF1295 domain-containing protein [Mycoplasma sp.]
MELLIQLSIIFAISIGVNMFFFVIAFLVQKDLFTDITYASTFLITMIIQMAISHNYGINIIIALILIALWSVRLGTFLFIRILKEKVDHRFDKMRGSFYKFFMFWLLQGITVFIVAMPSYMVTIFGKDEFNLLSLIGIIGAAISLLFETIADIQKYRYYSKGNKKFIDYGLWKISRHPNYFGEYMFWIFNFVFVVLSTNNPLIWISIVGPLFILTLLYFVSGLPLLEKVMYKKFGEDEQYKKYLSKTPRIVPFIGIKGIKKKWAKK